MPLQSTDKACFSGCFIINLRLAISKMAKENPPTPVLRILLAVHAATKDRRPPYVILDSLDIDDTRERVAIAAIFAGARGWLEVRGNPPHSAAITDSGIALVRPH